MIGFAVSDADGLLPRFVGVRAVLSIKSISSEVFKINRVSYL